MKGFFTKIMWIDLENLQQREVKYLPVAMSLMVYGIVQYGTSQTKLKRHKPVSQI